MIDKDREPNVRTETELKIISVLKDNNMDPTDSCRLIWRLSRGRRSEFMKILKTYAKPEFWANASDFEVAFDEVLAEFWGEGSEVEWLGH